MEGVDILEDEIIECEYCLKKLKVINKIRTEILTIFASISESENYIIASELLTKMERDIIYSYEEEKK